MANNYNQDKDKEPEIEFAILWEDFIQNTGFHGVNKLSSASKSRKLRIGIWSSAVIGSTAYLIYIVVALFQHYNSYPITTAMYTQSHSQLKFPAVTICNLSPLNKSAVKNDSRIDNYYLSVSIMKQFAEPINWTDPFYEEEGFFKNRSMEEALAVYKNDFTLYFIFDAKLLDLDKFTSASITQSGPCLTFNHDGILATTYTGSKFNLMLWIDVHVKDSYFGESFGDGVKFIVHEPTEDPDFDGSSGYYVSPGREVFAVVTKNQFEYLPSPYQAMDGMTCRSHVNSDGSEYSKSKCLRDCYERYLYNACGCVDILSRDELYCSKYDYARCAKGARDMFNGIPELSESCNCQLSCKSAYYDVTLTTSVFPSDFYKDYLWLLANQQGDIDYHRKNFLLVHIYYDQLKTVISKQSPKYSSVGDILADLGGQMGLLLGASIITLTELGEFLFFSVCLLFSRIRKRTQIREKNMRCRKDGHKMAEM